MAALATIPLNNRSKEISKELQSEQQINVPEVEDLEFCLCLYLSETEKTKTQEEREKMRVCFSTQSQQMESNPIPLTWIFHMQLACTRIAKTAVAVVHKVLSC